MAEKYYLAVDIGASSGRHILGSMKEGKLHLEEIYRFENGLVSMDGANCWDVDRLFQEILRGMEECVNLGKIPISMGIDTWAVDFVLIDKAGKRLGNAVSYRDSRTDGMDQEVYSYIDEEELYTRTGIQKQKFNTIYQLMAVKKKQKELLLNADKLLLIPDYFHYLLTGKAVTEYTNATTTQLVSPKTKDWDWNLIQRLNYPGDIFQEIRMPGTALGGLREEIQKEVGYDCQVILPATHDTASAVMAVPATEENVLYISSGTWSLMGTELLEANCSAQSRLHNITNEGGYEYRFRYLKNIMGLWMIQKVRKEIAKDMSFGEICELASKQDIASLVDCGQERFLAPESMVKEVQRACEETRQQIPQGIGEVSAVVYRSLASCYAQTLQELETLTKRRFETLHIVGGGANADYLNRLTAQKTKRAVVAGPTEATATGNILAQMIAAGEFMDLKAARKCVYDSFLMKEYK